MEFKERLFELRNELGVKSKQEMANKLGIARTLYSMLENGNRQPSKDVLNKLFLLTGKPEEYWLYGITNEKEFLKTREIFKMTKQTVSSLISLDLIQDPDALFDLYLPKDGEKMTMEQVLIASLKADIKHLIAKSKMDNE